MPVPVVMQAGFQLEPLAGEAGVQGFRACQRMRATPGLPHGIPHDRPRAVRHLDGAVQMIDVHHQQRGRRVDIGHDRDGPVDGRA